MKVIHILDNLGRGGMETLLLDVCRNANVNDLNMLLVLTGSGDILRDFKNSGVDLVILKRNWPLDIKLILKLRTLFLKEQVDLVHVHEAVTGIHTYFATMGTNIKIVMSIHGYIPNKKDDLVRSFLINKVDRNLSVSKAFLDFLSSNTKFNTSNNFNILHNGIDQNKLQDKVNNLKCDLKIKNSDILLGMVGNFYNSGRDQITICKALPILFSKYKNIHFVFIGGFSSSISGYYDECYEFCLNNNILDRTHFLGSRTDINNILRSLDVYVYSSNHDSFGISVVEAMMVGLPVIINDLPTLLEITDNGKYAMVFKSKDETDLVIKVDMLINNPELRTRLGNSGKEFALNNYSIEKYISNLTNLYNDVLNN